MASPRWMLPLLILGTSVITLVPAAQQFHDELFRNTQKNVVRKQRSLDADSPEYYNDQHLFKYHGNTDRKFDLDFDENDQEIEPLTSDNGVLETVEDDYEGFVQRVLAKVKELLRKQKEDAEASSFRERERNGNKRNGAGNQLNQDDRGLTKLFVEELQDGSPYGSFVEVDDDDYLTTLQSLYDRYRAGKGNKVYETAGPMSWGELLSQDQLRSETKNGNDEFVDRDQDQDILYLSGRNNVNGRFPSDREFIGKLTKRYPVAKRSPRPTQTRLKTTDPKVAQDLGALFGTQFIDSHNHTHKADHEHEHEHDHDHERKQEPNHDHEHEHKHEPNQNHEHEHEGKMEVPSKVTPSTKSQKENVTKIDKSKYVQVRKKSVDWSQYFGIDRRKKKATFTAGQGTQNQDDEWMLQRYYENMAENLKSKDDENEQKDKLEQIDTKLKYIKDLILEDAMKLYGVASSEEVEKVKDKLMSRMTAAYSVQKMRKALNDLRSSIAAQREAQKTQKETQNNFTSNFRENSNNPSINTGGSKTDEKRGNINNNLEESELIEEPRSCPELEAIEWRCRTVDNLAGDTSRLLYVPCVKLQICKACSQDEEGLLPCLANYALEVEKVCDAMESSRDGQSRLAVVREGERQSCANAALLLSQLQPPSAATAQCRARNSCLRRYHARYEHRYFRTSPAYEGTGRRFHHEGALDALQQTMSER